MSVVGLIFGAFVSMIIVLIMRFAYLRTQIKKSDKSIRLEKSFASGRTSKGRSCKVNSQVKMNR